MRCPLSSDKWGALASCSYENCALSDEAGNCLIKQALQLYVSQERAKIAMEEQAQEYFRLTYPRSSEALYSNEE